MSNMYKRIKNDPRMTPKKKKPISAWFGQLKEFVNRRGRNPWKANLSKKKIRWPQVLAPILIVTIPLIVMMAADNTLLRLPDLYKYHFLSAEMLSENRITADEDDVAQLISDYLIGKTDTFQMKEDLDYMPAELFTDSDGAMIRGIRELLNVGAITGAIMLLISVVIIIYLYRKREKDLILRYYYYALPAFVVFQLVDALFMLITSLRTQVYGIPPLEVEQQEDLLPVLLDGTFFRLLTIGEVALSMVFLGLIYYLVLNLSGRKTTFRR